MRKKNKILLTLLTVLTLIPSIPSYASVNNDGNAVVNPIIVSHSLPAANDNTQMSSVTGAANGGFGWADNSYWHIGTAPTQDAVTAANRVVRKIVSGQNTYYLFNPKASGAGLYRTMAQENYIDPTVDADYFISFVSRDALGSMDSVTNNPSAGTRAIDHKFFIGSTSLYASFSKFASGTDTNKLITALTVNSETNATTKSIQCGTLYKNLIWIDANESGNDVVKYQIVGINEDFNLNSWDVEKSADLGSDKFSYVGIQSNGQGTAQVGDIKIEKYQNLATVLDDYATLSSGGNLTGEECESMLNSIARYTDGTVKDVIFPVLTQYITGNGYNDLLSSAKTLSSIEENSVIHAQDCDKIEISFNYAFGNDNYTATFTKDGESAQADISFNTNKLIADNLSLLPDSEYILKITDADNIFNVGLDGFEFKFRTSIVPVINVSNGDVLTEGDIISWNDAQGITTTVKIDETEIVNGAGVTGENGEYTLTLTSVKGEETATRSIEIVINKPTAPVAKNVKIELKPVAEGQATVETDAVLIGSYDYYDINNDAEDENSTIYKWYSCNKDGTGETEIGTGKEYTLTQADENKYIVLKVTPASVAQDATKFGDTVPSAIMAGAFKPTASNVQFVKKPIIGEKLEVKFDFNDINGDAEDTADYEWHIVDSSVDNIVIPEFSEGEEQDYSKLLIKEEYIGKQIYVKVTPKSKKKPYSGDTIITETVYAPDIPVIENVIINGSSKVGNSIYVTYNFKDINNDQEGASKIEWIDVSTGTVLSTGASLSLGSNHSGLNIVVRVTPFSTEKPYEGSPLTSSSVYVKSSGDSSGGGGFSFSGSSSGSKKPENEAEKEEKPSTPDYKVFADTVGHWSEDYIARCKELGVVNGKTETTFEPNGNVTRAEILAMLLRAKGIDMPEYNGGFADVSADAWYAGYVQYAVDNGIISKAEHFRPNDNVKRCEAAKMIAIANNITTDSEVQLTYNDFNTFMDWSMEFISALFEAGIMTGDDKGNFNANQSLKRGEMAKIICTTIDYNENVDASEKNEAEQETENEEAAQ